MGVRVWLCQYYGFVVKTFTQRLKAPIATLIELLLPCLFILLLSICYWASDTVVTPESLYTSFTINASEIASYFVCTKGTSVLDGTLPWRRCAPSVPLYCLPNVADGGLCFPQANYASITGFMFAMYYGKGPYTVNPMDAHLFYSALVAHMSKEENPTFFGRSGKASLSHYGKLLVSSASADVARRFMSFCRQRSGMCAQILFPTVFSNFEEAQKYAVKNENEVWAILDLPSEQPAGATSMEFTIGMNYSATPWTFPQKRTLFKGLGSDDGSDGYILYWTSGFLTLQTFVEEFYLDQRIAEFGAPVPQYANMSQQLNRYGAGVIPMPTSAFYDNEFLKRWMYFMPLVAVLAAMYPIARWTGMLVEEKSKGIREAMLIMGLYPSCLFSGWYTVALITDIIASLLAALMFKIGFLKHVEYGVLFVVYFSFMQNNTALSAFLSTFFSNPRVASWCAAFIVFICAMPFYVMPQGMSMRAKRGVSFIPCVGYAEAFDEMTKYSSYQYHFGWREAHQSVFSVVIAIAMMWSSTGVMGLLTLYLDRVWPAAVGRRAHPLFFLVPLFHRFRREKIPLVPMCDPCGKSAGSESSSLDKRAMLEHRDDTVDPTDPGIVAVFHQLRKEYECGGLLGFLYTYFTGLIRKGDHCVALNGVTFAMRMGEVSVLLGPNGAGKSTIMGIATGMVEPSSGEVYVRGYNAAYHLQKCRESVGYCPQNNVVWSSLTVEEHLSFYARLKGVGAFHVQAAVDEVVESLGMAEKRHTSAGALSGGLRRRLCVGIALIGDSTLLFLDEPTAGMDIKGRRTVYDALNRSRSKRSVLISTHLLDEADRIGDQVVVVSAGEVRGQGSSMYLKSQMSVGYVVTCVINDGLTAEEETCAVGRLMDFVREEGYSGHHTGAADEVQAVPPGCMLLGMDRRGREVVFRFPLSLLSTFGETLLESLDKNRTELHLRSVGLGLATLEDVFTKLAQDGTVCGESEKEGDSSVVFATGDPVEYGGTGEACNAPSNSYAPPRHISGFEKALPSVVVFGRHFRALFVKRLHFAKRDARLLVFQVILPVVFLLLALLVNLVGAPMQPSLRLDNSMYGKSVNGQQSKVFQALALRSANVWGITAPLPAEAFGDGYSTNFSRYMDTNGTYPTSVALLPDLLRHEEPRRIAISYSNLVMISGRPRSASCVMHNATMDHAAPEAISALYNAANYRLFRSRYPTISVRNRPITLGKFEKQLVDASKQVLVGIFILIPFIVMPSNTIGYVVREKESGARHMQWLSGASASAYWMSSFLFDALCFIGTQILTFVILAIFQRTEYVGKSALGPMIVLFFMYGMSSIALSYLVSFFFRSPFAAQSVVLVVNFVAGFLWVMIESMLSPSALNVVRYLTYILRVLPAVNFSESMFVVSGISLANMMFPKRVRPNMFGLLRFMPDGKFSGGVGTSLIYLSIVLVCSCLGLVLLEYLRLQRISFELTRLPCCGRSKADEDDEDGGRATINVLSAEARRTAQQAVDDEESRVCQRRGGPLEDRIAVQHLSKRYFGSKHFALNNVSLGVHAGEVMALLGLNGAGKTTMLSILAGEVIPSSGTALVNRLSVMNLSSRSYVGYCPQFDALLDNLSPTEHLWLYARLRGLPEELIATEVDMLLRELGLYPHRRQAAEALSGGNRRRLSLAIALVGNTTSVLLDEPTSGMDTIARGQTCAMVKRLTRRKSVLLTTHLLDETEALADRAAFIRKGHLQCVGTLGELRNHYTDDALYLVRVVFPSDVHLLTTDADVVERVRCHLLSVVPGREKAAESDAACRVCEVQSASMSLSVEGRLFHICKGLADLRGGSVEGVPMVTYASASQPTLEDIMLME